MRALWPAAIVFFVLDAAVILADLWFLLVRTDFHDDLRYGLLVLAGILFLIWLYRARINAEQLSPVRHRFTRGWVIGSWMIPILSFWWPKQIVDDVWRTSERPVETINLRKGPKPALVRAWWTAWIISTVGSFLLMLVLHLLEVAEGTVELTADLVSVLAEVAAGVLLVGVVVKITRIQMSHTVAVTVEPQVSDGI